MEFQRATLKKDSKGLVAVSASNHDDAVGHVVAFLVAGFVFVGSVGAVLYTSGQVDGAAIDDGQTAAALRVQAESLASLLLKSPGLTSTGVDWADKDQTATHIDDPAEALVRLGLMDGEVGQRGYLDFEKFNNLRLAPLAAQDDGYVNYDEAVAAMGLQASGLDFHIRSFPNLQSVREILASGTKDQNLRVAYIGDVEAVASGGGSPTDGLVVGQPTCTLRADGRAYTISNSVTNGGNTTVQFSGFYEVELGTGADYVDRTRTYLVPVGAPPATISLDVPATSGRSCSTGVVTLEIYDRAVRLGDAMEWPISGGPTASSAVANDLWMNPSKTYFNAGEDVVLDFDGTLPKQGSDPSVTLSLTVKRSNLTTVYGPVDLVVTKHVRSVTVLAANFDSAVTTDYLAELSYPGVVSVTDPVLVLPSGQVPGVYTPSSGAVTYEATTPVPIEVGYLEQLVEKFCPFYFDTTSYSEATSTPLVPAPAINRCNFPRNENLQLGDVFPDLNGVMNDKLPLRLINPLDTGYVQQCSGNLVGGPRYDWTKILVVGSNVDHNSMTSGAAKHAVCEWVMGGGTLIVFGSGDQNVQWLQPIFHSAIKSSSGGIAVPDSSHPVLHVSDDLPVTTFQHTGVWSFTGQTAQAQESPTSQLFTNVVVDGADPVLTVSDPGAFGKGSVILTTYLPYDLTAQDPEPTPPLGLNLMNNLLMQGYRDLFLDYGPEIPASDHDVIPAVRKAQICHPELAPDWDGTGDCPPEARISLDVIVYVFRRS